MLLNRTWISQGRHPWAASNRRSGLSARDVVTALRCSRLAAPFGCQRFIGKSFNKYASHDTPSLKANLFAVLRVVPVSQRNTVRGFVRPVIDRFDEGAELFGS